MPELDTLVGPGTRVAVADGCGTPTSLFPALSKRAADVGDVSLVLGWMLHNPSTLELDQFRDVRTVMSGWGMRAALARGNARSVPARLSAVPGLLRGPMRPDVVLCTVVAGPGGFYLGSEACWVRGLIDEGTPTVAVLSWTAPRADAGPPLPTSNVFVVGESDDPPFELAPQQPGEVEVAIAENLSKLIPENARIQVGPGRVGTAMLERLTAPVHIDSGLLFDSVVDLDARGMLLGTPVSTYLAGTPKLYDWAHGRRVLHPVEFTHDLRRLSSDPPLIAINTALEIDLNGQVNVEGVGETSVGGVGGHPDYMLAGTVSRHGLSIIAVPSEHGGRSALVERLSRPVTTPSHDVDVVATEKGCIDLRGLDRQERADALLNLWDGNLQPAMG